jgi:hypothetical protein
MKKINPRQSDLSRVVSSIPKGVMDRIISEQLLIICGGKGINLRYSNYPLLIYKTLSFQHVS